MLFHDQKLTFFKLIFLLYLSLFLGLFSAPTLAASSHYDCAELFTLEVKSADRTLDREGNTQIQGYLDDTIHSLNQMRGANGLLNDTIWIESKADGSNIIRAVQSNTSPSNIGADLIVQTELAIRNSDSTARSNLNQILSTLKGLAKHNESGLFFSWYSTDQTSKVANYAVSSIDNLHLAIALWTIKESFSGTELARRAEELFRPMNFSMFYDVPTGLIHGNFAYIDGKWVRETYTFANMGSEARLLYTAGWALGLFKNFSKKTDFVAKACTAMKCEILQTEHGPMLLHDSLLKEWTGSAFQLYFPEKFGGEENYSPVIKNLYKSLGNYMIAEGERRGIALPAGCSPCVVGIIEDKNGNFYSEYNPNLGNIALVSSDNQDVLDPSAAAKWEATVTPHALVMAAVSNIKSFLPILRKTESIKSGNNALYIKGMGWADALKVVGPDAGTVVPAQEAISQTVIAISLMQIQSADGLSASGRALFKNRKVRARMKLAYQIVDGKLKEEASK